METSKYVESKFPSDEIVNLLSEAHSLASTSHKSFSN